MAAVEQSLMHHIMTAADFCHSMLYDKLLDLEPVFSKRAFDFATPFADRHVSTEKLTPTSKHSSQAETSRRIFEDKIEQHLHDIGTHLEAITQHIGSITELKSSLNGLAPIQRLPPEILSEIFLQYAALYNSNEGPVAWQSVSHICRHWRTVALQCSQLWTSIDLRRNGEATKTFLSRSKKAPLVIEGYLPSWEDAQMILEAESPRIEVLKLTVYRRRAPEKLDPTTILDPAPLLKILELTGTASLSLTDDLYAFWNILYGVAAPQLQRLTLRNVLFQWHPDFLHTNLRSLCIECPMRNGENILLTDVLSALAESPLLEDLKLDHCLPKDILPSGLGGRMVVLPTLQSITICAESLTCANLISYLDVPSKPSISIRGDDIDPRDHSCISLNSCVSRFHGSRAFQHLTVSNVLNTFELKVLDTSKEVPNIELHPVDESKTFPKLSFTILAKSRLYETFTVFRDRLPLDEVLEFTIVKPTLWERDYTQGMFTLGEAFRRMHKARTLCVRQVLPVTSRPIFAALLMRESAKRVDPLVLPFLQEVQFHDIDFSENAHEQEFRALIDCLTRRQERGFGVQKVVFNGWPTFTQAKITRLQAIVPTVIVVGLEEKVGRIIQT